MKVTTALFVSLLTLAAANNVYAATTHSYTMEKSAGQLTYEPSDFSDWQTQYPKQIADHWPATFNDTRVNRQFMHTFKPLQVKKGCSVTKAQLTVKVKNNGSTSSNDNITIMHAGATLGGEVIWQGSASSRTIQYDLNNIPAYGSAPGGSILNSLTNNQRLSVAIQDDTQVNKIRLDYTVTCPEVAKDMKGEHFSCYKVEKGDALKPEMIGVQDQFGRDRLVLGKPKLLCNPSAKVHNDKKYNILRKERHLVCYEIVKQGRNKPQHLKVNNQFAPDEIVSTQREMFCVPSYKEHMKEK